ncbi:MAG: hypothetical protein GXN92_02710 [Candidatus Micrarchaeota archaeon]|nr:hypothetical protein [Candidatus Micrarchaeota archaeon]
MNTVREVMNYLVKRKLVEKRTMSRQEVRKKYGYDAFAIYKRFGSYGVLFYRMLGGDYSTRESIKKFAKLSGLKDPDKILEIMKMVHSILGLTIPITRETIVEILSGD